MNNVKFLPCIFLLVLGLMTSCSKDDDPVESEITYLPKLTMEGPSSVQLDCSASSFSDPGVTATEGGQDVQVLVNTKGKYFGSSEVNGPDDYVISYVAYNNDSIPGATTRSILLPECNGDLVNSIAGMYVADVVRNGSVDPTYQGLQYVIIKDLGNNMYQLSDAIGGYYDYGRGFGDDYAGKDFVVTANNIGSNDFTHDQVIGVGLFGGDLSMTSFSVDAANRKISFTTDWSFGFVFEVTLTQVDL